jgi:hypothetical protein
MRKWQAKQCSLLPCYIVNEMPESVKTKLHCLEKSPRAALVDGSSSEWRVFALRLLSSFCYLLGSTRDNNFVFVMGTEVRIYIYIYMCVCVSFLRAKSNELLTSKFKMGHIYYKPTYRQYNERTIDIMSEEWLCCGHDNNDDDEDDDADDDSRLMFYPTFPSQTPLPTVLNISLYLSFLSCT